MTTVSRRHNAWLTVVPRGRRGLAHPSAKVIQNGPVTILKILVSGRPSLCYRTTSLRCCTAVENRTLHQDFALAETISGRTLCWVQVLGCSHSLCMLELCCCWHPSGFAGWSHQVAVSIQDNLPGSCSTWHGNNVLTIFMALSLSFIPPMAALQLDP